jgi:hypothetical protein
MVDTGFFIIANRERPENERTEDHVEAPLKLEKSGADILIAAPMLAELLRRKYTEPPPATRWPVVSFGRLAAELLGRKLPQRFVEQPGIPSGYWKYDAMIAACAVVARADAIMVADADYTNILKALDPEGSIRCLRAEDITGRQLSLRYRPLRQSIPIVEESEEPVVAPAVEPKPGASAVTPAAPSATQQPSSEPPPTTGASPALASPPQEQTAPTAPPGEPPDQTATPTSAGLLADLTPLAPDEPVE